MPQPFCPCCGAPVRESGVAFDDEHNAVQTVRGIVVLGPQQYEFLKLLHACWPKPAYVDWLVEALHFRSEGNLRKTASRTRQRVSTLGLSVAGGGAGGFGPRQGTYRLQLPPGVAKTTRPLAPTDEMLPRRAAR